VITKLLELGRGDAFQRAPLELRRTLERNQALVVVRVNASDIRIAPGGMNNLPYRGNVILPSAPYDLFHD